MYSTPGNKEISPTDKTLHAWMNVVSSKLVLTLGGEGKEGCLENGNTIWYGNRG